MEQENSSAIGKLIHKETQVTPPIPQPPTTGVDKNIIPLLKKINTAVKTVTWAAKDGRNDTQRYSYTSEAGVLAQVKKAFEEAGIVLTHHQHEPFKVREVKAKSGSVMPITRIRIDFKMSDAETGAYIITPCYGDGMDSGDKGLYKAITGATKYFLLKTMMIPTGDDPEKDSAAEDSPKTKVKVEKPGDNGKKPDQELGKLKHGALESIEKLPEGQRKKMRDKITACKTEAALTKIEDEIAMELF